MTEGERREKGERVGEGKRGGRREREEERGEGRRGRWNERKRMGREKMGWGEMWKGRKRGEEGRRMGVREGDIV